MRNAVILALACLGTACTEKKAAPPPPAVDAGAPEAAGSQPGAHGASQPGSAASIPADHDTSTRTATLRDMFVPPEAPDNVVATVGGTKIMVEDLEQELREIMIQLSAAGLPDRMTQYQVWRGALDRQIEKIVRVRLAKSLNVELKEEDVKAWLAEMESRMAANPSFKVFLAKAGKTPETMRSDAEQSVLLDGIVDQLRKEVANETVEKTKEYYERNKRDFLVREGKEAWRLFIDAPRSMIQRDRDVAKARAVSLHKEASKRPGNFENLVKSHSEGGKRMHGGYLGYVAKGTLDLDMEKQLYAAKTETILPLREEPSGFYIYKAGKYRPQSTKPFEDVQEEILNKVFQEQITKKVRTRLEEMRAELPVVILAPRLAEMDKANHAKNQAIADRMKQMEKEYDEKKFKKDN